FQLIIISNSLELTLYKFCIVSHKFAYTFINFRDFQISFFSLHRNGINGYLSTHVFLEKPMGLRMNLDNNNYMYNSTITLPFKEDMLMAGMEGYADYQNRVKYKLIPGIY
ncbi:MAG: hypothetical protein KAH12_04060, partial [Anaerolineales bacterium]|nr:hypothetical protein [Anaerolineales bacterium]